MSLSKHITVYQASNQQAYDTSEKAAAATLNHLCGVFSALLQPLLDDGRLTASERFKVVQVLAGTDIAVAKLCQNVLPILNWVVNNAEDEQL